MSKLKLSELKNEERLVVEGSGMSYTAAELKREIIELGEPHHLTDNWVIATDAVWKPDAETMFQQYRDNEAEDLYEDAEEHIDDKLKEDTIAKLQAVLDEAFGEGLGYWIYGKDVEIDILPQAIETTA